MKTTTKSKESKLQKNQKTSKTRAAGSSGEMDAEVVKKLVGDEIARIAQRTEYILGKSAGDVGEMIAEELASQMPDVRKRLLALLIPIEQQSTPEDLAKRWVDWRSKTEQAKMASPAVGGSSGEMDAEVVKRLVGDEIARIAQRAEYILGKSVVDLGKMIAEELASQMADVRKRLLALLVPIEQQSTPEDLVKRWVDWKSKRALAKKASLSRLPEVHADAPNRGPAVTTGGIVAVPVDPTEDAESLVKESPPAVGGSQAAAEVRSQTSSIPDQPVSLPSGQLPVSPPGATMGAIFGLAQNVSAPAVTPQHQPDQGSAAIAGGLPETPGQSGPESGSSPTGAR